MLYQRLRAREFANPIGPVPQFPGVVEVRFSLLPPWAFGVKDGGSLSRAAFCDVNPLSGKGEGSVLHADRHRGRLWATSPNPLKPLEVCLTGPGQTYTLRGSELVMQVLADSLIDLDAKIQRIYYWLPVYLNLDFADPPTIASVDVQMGTSAAVWVPKMAAGTVFPGDQVTQTDHVKSALNRVLLEDTAEVRLLAALEYFYSATRLTRLGETPGEFLGEVILNFAKILEVLFCNFEGKTTGSMDRARAGLSWLKYSDDTIEEAFVPAIALRNSLGVGHPGLAQIAPEDLEAVHWYADSAEQHFRELMKRVIVLPPDQRAFLATNSTAIDKSLENLIGRVRGAMKKAHSRMSEVTITSAPKPIPPTSKYK